MSDLSKLIDNKEQSAKYMVEEITHICKDLPKRGPGSEGEKQACEYMAGVLKNDCGCDSAEVESFKLNPGSFYGWIYFTITCAIISAVLFFFIPLVSIILIAVGLFVMVMQFGLYLKFVDRFFKEETGHNVTAIKKPTGELKARIVFNGHPDAAWHWPVNYKFGGVAHAGHIVISVIGALVIWVLCMVATGTVNSGFAVATPETYGGLFWAGIAALIFVPFQIGMYWMWDKNKIVDGANDNLSGCYMGIAVLKAMKDQGIELKNTEIAVVLTGCEEAGLRGAKAWCEAHKDDFREEGVPTFIYSFDTIHDPKFLAVNYRDLNATVKADEEVGDLFMECAKELNIGCARGMVPPFGGATDSAAFAQAGFRSTGVTGLDHNLERYYHTIDDTYTNMNERGLAECFAVTVKVLEKFDEKYGK